MKLCILILSAFLMTGCGNNASNTNANSNFNRVARTATPSNKEENLPLDKEMETRVIQKMQEFINTNYAGWTLKGTGNISAASPIDLHIIKGADEKIVKVNFKELNDLNGQPYIVVSQVSQRDLNEPALDNKLSNSNLENSVNSNASNTLTNN